MSSLSPQQIRDAVRDVGKEMFRIGLLGFPAAIIMTVCGAAIEHVFLVASSGAVTVVVGFGATLWGCMRPPQSR